MNAGLARGVRILPSILWSVCVVSISRALYNIFCLRREAFADVLVTALSKKSLAQVRIVRTTESYTLPVVDPRLFGLTLLM